MSETPAERKHRPTMMLRHEPGAAPGTLYFNPSAPISKVRVIGFGPNGVDERVIKEIPDLRLMMMRHPFVWINVDGVEDSNTLQQIGELFMLHPLCLEDVQNTQQRPKVDAYPEHLFVLMRTLEFKPELQVDQLSMFIGDNYLITFQQYEGDPLDPIRRRILQGQGNIRTAGMGFLGYSIIDAVIDNYFPVMEVYGERLETLEGEAAASTQRSTLAAIYQVKRDLFAVRKALWPLREVVNAMCRDDHRWFAGDTKVYLRDCYDHMVQLLDLVETNRELCSALMEFYLSCQGTRMNEVMKLLTIMSTLFIPLTFIVGVYGMNFDNMPELHSPWGYHIAWGVMAGIVAVELAFFYRRGWLGASSVLDAHKIPPGPEKRGEAQEYNMDNFRTVAMPNRVDDPGAAAALRSTPNPSPSTRNSPPAPTAPAGSTVSNRAPSTVASALPPTTASQPPNRTASPAAKGPSGGANGQ